MKVYKKYKILRFKQKPVLTVKNLSKKIDKRMILKGINFDIYPGEIFGLIGPNGAGKTLTMCSILGLVKPSAGKIYMSGVDVTELSVAERCKRFGISFISQNNSTFRSMSVEDNLYSIAQVVMNDKKAINERVENLLGEFGLAAIRKTKANMLSGGEIRKTMICRALIISPKLCIMDEPLSFLDPLSIEIIISIIINLQRKKISVCVTDHQIKFLLKICDRVSLIYDGANKHTGTPSKLIADPKVREMYLGSSFNL